MVGTFLIYDVRGPTLLVEVNFYVISHYLPDNPDKFVGTVPKSIIASTAFSHLGIVIDLEGGILYRRYELRNKSITEDFGFSVDILIFLNSEAFWLIERRIRAGKSEQLVGVGKTVDLTNFRQESFRR